MPVLLIDGQVGSWDIWVKTLAVIERVGFKLEVGLDVASDPQKEELLFLFWLGEPRFHPFHNF